MWLDTHRKIIIRMGLSRANTPFVHRNTNHPRTKYVCVCAVCIAVVLRIDTTDLTSVCAVCAMCISMCDCLSVRVNIINVIEDK